MTHTAQLVPLTHPCKMQSVVDIADNISLPCVELAQIVRSFHKLKLSPAVFSTLRVFLHLFEV